MSTPIVGQIQSLLAQLKELNLKDPPPELEEQLLALQAAASATQAELHKYALHSTNDAGKMAVLPGELQIASVS